MSILYFILFFHRPSFGYFSWGRCIDLAQMDLIALLLIMSICYLRRIVNYQKWRWERLQKQDWEREKELDKAG